MKDNNYQQKVLVVVKGGLVQSLYATDREIEIEILDFDNEDFESREEEEKELIKRSEGLLAIL